MTPELFIKCIERAAKYRIEDINTVERIAILHLQEGSGTLPVAQVDEQFTRREAYLEGALTDAPDISTYDPPEENTPTDP